MWKLLKTLKTIFLENSWIKLFILIYSQMEDNISEDLRTLRRCCSKMCPYNKNWWRYSRRQYEAHFTSKYHIPRELSANEDTFENQDDYNYSDNSHDFNVTLSMDSLPSSQSAQQETLISSSNNLTFTERNLLFGN